MSFFKSVFIFVVIALFCYSQVSSYSVNKLTKKKTKTTTEAPSDFEHCANGMTPPHCCLNGSTSPYCCANNSNSPYCCANGSTSRYCCKNNSRYSDCRDEKVKG